MVRCGLGCKFRAGMRRRGWAGLEPPWSRTLARSGLSEGEDRGRAARQHVG
jgi:hypothetical protein